MPFHSAAALGRQTSSLLLPPPDAPATVKEEESEIRSLSVAEVEPIHPEKQGLRSILFSVNRVGITIVIMKRQITWSSCFEMDRRSPQSPRLVAGVRSVGVIEG